MQNTSMRLFRRHFSYLYSLRISRALALIGTGLLVATSSGLTRICHADGSERPESTPGRVPIGAEYVKFKINDASIQLGNLGGPAWKGLFEGVPATIEFSSNVPVSVQYQTGQNLHSVIGYTLPTQFMVRLKGSGLTNNQMFAFRSSYGPAFDLGGPNSQGYVIFAPNAISNGLQLQVQATRNGVNDPAGVYTTNIVLNWCKL